MTPSEAVMAAVAVPPVETDWHEVVALQHQGDEVGLLRKLRPAVYAATRDAGGCDSHKAAVLNTVAGEHVRRQLQMHVTP